MSDPAGHDHTLVTHVGAYTGVDTRPPARKLPLAAEQATALRDGARRTQAPGPPSVAVRIFPVESVYVMEPKLTSTTQDRPPIASWSTGENRRWALSARSVSVAFV